MGPLAFPGKKPFSTVPSASASCDCRATPGVSRVRSGGLYVFKYPPVTGESLGPQGFVFEVLHCKNFLS